MITTKFTIHAFLQTLSPLHIATPGDMRLNLDTMEPSYNGTGVPCTQAQKLTVALPTGGVSHVPVIPANNIAGRLRRHAASQILSVLIAKKQTITIQTYSALNCGAVTGKPDGRDVTFEEYRETRAHPYIGLFGGGPRLMKRHVRCFNAVPYMEATRFMFERVRHPNLDDYTHLQTNDPRRLFSRWIFNRNDDLRDLVNLAQAEASIDDFERQIIERQRHILSDKSAAGEEGQKSSRHSTKTFSSFEFVLPGVIFPVSFELDVTPAQLGLFLLTLDSFSSTERLGGHSRNGLGQFSISDVLIQNEDGNTIASNVFHASRLQQNHEFVAIQLDAWAAAAQQINAADLDRLFAPPVEPEKKPKKAAEV